MVLVGGGKREDGHCGTEDEWKGAGWGGWGGGEKIRSFVEEETHTTWSVRPHINISLLALIVVRVFVKR